MSNFFAALADSDGENENGAIVHESEVVQIASAPTFASAPIETVLHPKLEKAASANASTTQKVYNKPLLVDERKTGQKHGDGGYNPQVKRTVVKAQTMFKTPRELQKEQECAKAQLIKAEQVRKHMVSLSIASRQDCNRLAEEASRQRRLSEEARIAEEARIVEEARIAEEARQARRLAEWRSHREMFMSGITALIVLINTCIFGTSDVPACVLTRNYTRIGIYKSMVSVWLAFNQNVIIDWLISCAVPQRYTGDFVDFVDFAGFVGVAMQIIMTIVENATLDGDVSIEFLSAQLFLGLSPYFMKPFVPNDTYFATDMKRRPCHPFFRAGDEMAPLSLLHHIIKDTCSCLLPDDYIAEFGNVEKDRDAIERVLCRFHQDATLNNRHRIIMAFAAQIYARSSYAIVLMPDNGIKLHDFWRGMFFLLRTILPKRPPRGVSLSKADIDGLLYSRYNDISAWTIEREMASPEQRTRAVELIITSISAGLMRYNISTPAHLDSLIACTPDEFYHFVRECSYMAAPFFINMSR